VTDRDDELGMRVHMGRAVREPGDLVIPLRDGVMDESHIAGEIGEVLTGACEGRQCDSQVILRPASRMRRCAVCTDCCLCAQITLFKSVGAAIEDLCASVALYGRALAEPPGTFPTM
jgi:ornithine cyclodeaminase/alanine dehydrogenase-like protein (mu-crystallin family)